METVAKLCKSLPYLDECRTIISKMLSGAVKDFMTLATDEESRLNHILAECFLFDDDYRVNWGGKERGLEEILAIIGIEIEWFRDEIIERYEGSYPTSQEEINRIITNYQCKHIKSPT